MRTEHDLREAIDGLAGPLTEPAELIERLLTPADSSPRAGSARIVKPLIAALAAAAVAVTGVVLLGSHGQHAKPTAAAPQVSSLEWAFSVAKVPGYTITRSHVVRYSSPTADVGELADVTALRSRVTGLLEHDSVPARSVRTGDVTTIAGQRYYFRAGRHVSRQGGLTPAQYAHPWVAAGQDAFGPTLAWQYADGSQFVLSGSFGFQPKTYDYDNARARTIMLRIARAVRTGLTDPVTMPFHVGKLHGGPLHEGLVPVALDVVTSAKAAPDSACLKYATPRQPSPMDPNESILIVCRVTIGTGERQALRSVNFGPTFVAASVVRRLSDGTVLAVGVAAGHDDAATRADLTRIADQTEVSPSLADSGTWLAIG